MEEEFKLEEPEVKEEANFSEPMVMDVPEEQKEEEPVMEMVMEFIQRKMIKRKRNHDQWK